MLRKLTGAIAAIASTATAAAAADLYRGPPSYPSAPAYGYIWSGPYVGANLGYQWGSLSNSGASPSGVAGGFQGGYNWQYGQMVIGGETDFELSHANDTFAGYKFSNPWFGTIRGRAGYAVNN